MKLTHRGGLKMNAEIVLTNLNLGCRKPPGARNNLTELMDEHNPHEIQASIRFAISIENYYSLIYIVLWLVVCWVRMFPYPDKMRDHVLTHWGRVTHICVSKLTINNGSDYGLMPTSKPMLGYCQLRMIEEGNIVFIDIHLIIQMYTRQCCHPTKGHKEEVAQRTFFFSYVCVCVLPDSVVVCQWVIMSTY